MRLGIFINYAKGLISFLATSCVIYGELDEFCILACDARPPKGSV